MLSGSGSLPDLVNQIRILVGQGGVLQSQIETAAATTTMRVEDAMKLWRSQGMSLEEIKRRLIEDLHAETSRLFGGFKSEIKSAVYGAENVAASMGMQTAWQELGKPKQLLRWQTNGVNICEDCMARHGEEDTLENWQVRGMPKTFGSRCGENCLCTLVPTDMVLEPIKVGQE